MRNALCVRASAYNSIWLNSMLTNANNRYILFVPSLVLWCCIVERLSLANTGIENCARFRTISIDKSGMRSYLGHSINVIACTLWFRFLIFMIELFVSNRHIECRHGSVSLKVLKNANRWQEMYKTRMQSLWYCICVRCNDLFEIRLWIFFLCGKELTSRLDDDSNGILLAKALCLAAITYVTYDMNGSIALRLNSRNFHSPFILCTLPCVCAFHNFFVSRVYEAPQFKLQQRAEAPNRIYSDFIAWFSLIH